MKTCTFMTIRRWIIFGMRIISDKSCGENQNTRFMFSNIFLKYCHLWDNVEKYGRGGQAADGSIIRCMRFAWWITKATDTHSENVIIIALARQQWLRECTSMLLVYLHFLFCEPCSDERFIRFERQIVPDYFKILHGCFLPQHAQLIFTAIHTICSKWC
jgi:hypothetical protein